MGTGVRFLPDVFHEGRCQEGLPCVGASLASSPAFPVGSLAVPPSPPLMDDLEAVKYLEQLPIDPPPRPSTPINTVHDNDLVMLFTPKKGRDIIEQMAEVGRK